MASSAKLLRRIGAALGHGPSGAALGHGAGEAKECTCRVLKELPPPGYLLTSSGILIPKHANNMVNGSVRRLSMNFVESGVLEKLERATGLFFRFTKVLVTTGGCYFALKLTWYEVTEKGLLQHYLPGGKENIDTSATVPVQSTSGYVEGKRIVDEVNKEKLAEFAEGCTNACETGNLLPFIDSVVLDHKLALVGKGLPADHIVHSQQAFFGLLRAAAKNCMLQSYRSKQESIQQKSLANEREEGQPPK